MKTTWECRGKKTKRSQTLDLGKNKQTNNNNKSFFTYLSKQFIVITLGSFLT